MGFRKENQGAFWGFNEGKKLKIVANYHDLHSKKLEKTLLGINMRQLSRAKPVSPTSTVFITFTQWPCFLKMVRPTPNLQYNKQFLCWHLSLPLGHPVNIVTKSNLD